jgi:hypothetical protein
MKKRGNWLLLILIFIFLFGLQFISAHQPRIIYDKTNVYENILNPEISQAFYGELRGNPDYYFINSTSDFVLYLNILSPDINNARKDFSFEIFSKNGNITVNGTNWKKFYEEFGGDNYWKGPEFEKNVSTGFYIIEITNPENEGRYSLAVGKIESFPFGESVKAIFSVIRLKHDFFNKSYFAFFEGIIGKMIGGIFLITAFIIWLVIFLVKRHKKKGKRHRLI